jgi:MFS family permease
MKEDLGFQGNELVKLQTMYILGAVLGQLPFMYLFTRVPMYYLIPIMDVAWGIFTLLQYRVTSYAEIAAYRFMVGWFEAAFFPAIHYIFGEFINYGYRQKLNQNQAPGTGLMNTDGVLAFSISALHWVLSQRP